MIHSTLVIMQTLLLLLVDDELSNYIVNLVVLSLLGTFLLILTHPVVNIFYSFGVLVFIIHEYQDIWGQWKSFSHKHNLNCNAYTTECGLIVAKYTFSFINVLVMFYYIVPVFLAIIIYSATFNKISTLKTKMEKRINFLRGTEESYLFSDMLNILYNETNIERERNIFKMITSKRFQNIMVGQHKSVEKDPLSILNYENAKGRQIYYVNNYSTNSNIDEKKQIFLYTSSGIRWIPGTS